MIFVAAMWHCETLGKQGRLLQLNDKVELADDDNSF
jgi:hypothetical protein